MAIPVVGDCRQTLEMLNELVKAQVEGVFNGSRGVWFDQIGEWKSTKKLDYRQTDMIKPQYVVETLHRLTKGEAIITTEVGQNQMWGGPVLPF